MKVAFVGKGGSGKSTLAALFVGHLIQNGDNVLAIDADVNVHLRRFLNIPDDYSTSISEKNTLEKIKKHIAGNNPLIDSSKIINTTPPGRGSRLVSVSPADELLSKIAYAKDRMFFVQVGLPEVNALGIKCYHINLESSEILLSHTNEKQGDFVVVDMVAGADAFATSMYIHFDALCVVVEPTEESVSVFRDYLSLAKEVNTEDKIVAIANKIEEADDLVFLQNSGVFPIGFISQDNRIRRALRDFGSLQDLDVDGVKDSLEGIRNSLLKMKVDKKSKLEKLHKLHNMVSQKPHNLSLHGDIRGQIDPDFYFN